MNIWTWEAWTDYVGYKFTNGYRIIAIYPYSIPVPKRDTYVYAVIITAYNPDKDEYVTAYVDDTLFSAGQWSNGTYTNDYAQALRTAMQRSLLNRVPSPGAQPR